MADTAARERYARKNEAADLKRAFELLDSKRDGRVDASELADTFQRLGHKAKYSEIRDMIWEVDEDCDQAVNWQEFQALYHRCSSDRAGSEPRAFFNVVQFIINDRERRSRVSLEEAMQILYLRYGRQLLDSQLEDIFGTSDINSGKSLSLTEFLQSLHTHQVKQLNNKVTSKTYKPSGGSQALNSTQARP